MGLNFLLFLSVADDGRYYRWYPFLAMGMGLWGIDLGRKDRHGDRIGGIVEG